MWTEWDGTGWNWDGLRRIGTDGGLNGTECGVKCALNGTEWDGLGTDWDGMGWNWDGLGVVCIGMWVIWGEVGRNRTKWDRFFAYVHLFLFSFIYL